MLVHIDKCECDARGLERSLNYLLMRVDEPQCLSLSELTVQIIQQPLDSQVYVVVEILNLDLQHLRDDAGILNEIAVIDCSLELSFDRSPEAIAKILG